MNECLPLRQFSSKVVSDELQTSEEYFREVCDAAMRPCGVNTLSNQVDSRDDELSFTIRSSGEHLYLFSRNIFLGHNRRTKEELHRQTPASSSLSIPLDSWSSRKQERLTRQSEGLQDSGWSRRPRSVLKLCTVRCRAC